MDEKIPLSTSWAIEAEGLTKSFGDRYALKGIDLRVRKGDCLTIFGPNGSGKTTLLKLLCTISKPSGGTAYIDGADLAKAPVEIRRKLGVVGHSSFLYSNLTINENLRFYGKMYQIGNLEQRITEVVSQVQLESRLHARVGTLSHGMQQRVAIARAVIHNPPIMLLDEPETGLDLHATRMMRDVLDTINSGERTIVMTTHNIEWGMEVSQQIAILDKGKIVYQELKQDIDMASFREVYDRCTGLSL